MKAFFIAIKNFLFPTYTECEYKRTFTREIEYHSLENGMDSLDDPDMIRIETCEEWTRKNIHTNKIKTFINVISTKRLKIQ